MPVSSVTSDLESLTITAVGSYPVPVERLWAAWADPRQLERFWGPPTWPATFMRHDLRAGGRSDYAMTGPNGESSRGYWLVEEAHAPERFVVHDGFADADGHPNDDLPTTRMEVTFEATAGGARFVAVSTFSSLDAIQAVLAMGVVEGFTSALAQMDDVLADLREATARATLERLDATHARVVRDVRGTIHQVWRAHHDAGLMRRWMLGPDGWTMPVCEVAVEVGQTYRYEWESEAGEGRFGFVGELVAHEPPRRAVTTEQMIGVEGPPVRNELVLVPLPGGRTRVTVTISYPSEELADMILATGMVDGMEASYARLEATISG
jgi:uncharacterized protein YndB with AHSA1/START domain